MKSETVIAIIGASVGVLGFLYGLKKDKDIRSIQRRANAPNFVTSGFTLNLCGWTELHGVVDLEYNPHIPEIERYLNDRKELNLPDDIPEGQLIACTLKNKCKEKIKHFEFKSRRKIFIDWESEDEGLMRLNYYHDPKNEIIKFAFKYETENGITGKRKYVFLPRQHSITERKI